MRRDTAEESAGHSGEIVHRGCMENVPREAFQRQKKWLEYQAGRASYNAAHLVPALKVKARRQRLKDSCLENDMADAQTAVDTENESGK
jgi:hypothetical protein